MPEYIPYDISSTGVSLKSYGRTINMVQPYD